MQLAISDNADKKLIFSDSDSEFSLFLYIDTKSLLTWLSIPKNIRDYCLDNSHGCTIIKEELPQFKDYGDFLIKNIINKLYECYQRKESEYGRTSTMVPMDAKMGNRLPEYSYFHKAFYLMHVAIWTIEADKYQADFDMNNTHVPFIDPEECQTETCSSDLSFDNCVDSNDFNSNKRSFAKINSLKVARRSTVPPSRVSNLFSQRSEILQINSRLESISRLSVELSNSFKNSSSSPIRPLAHISKYSEPIRSSGQSDASSHIGLFGYIKNHNLTHNTPNSQSRPAKARLPSSHSKLPKISTKNSTSRKCTHAASSNSISPPIIAKGTLTAAFGLSTNVPQLHSVYINRKRNSLNEDAFYHSASDLASQKSKKMRTTSCKAILTEPEYPLNFTPVSRTNSEHRHSQLLTKPTPFPDHVLGPQLITNTTHSLEFKHPKKSFQNEFKRTFKSIAHNTCLSNRPIPIIYKQSPHLSNIPISQLVSSPKPEFLNSINGNFIINSYTPSQI
ncbi:hypothetical protein AYI69_g4316 [Smittium culicis]|uniref:Uncharacterized protein n=1 Tax=Smittium culicis TaxID=133412 RepID=A0A1R1YEK7_9FUNG|nr:hypothetical protein AYI69_g4316 [Smittium culicis]